MSGFRTDSLQDVRRYDVGTLGSFERTPQGGFRIPARPTRVGVFPYLQSDGTVRREYRPPDEVLHPESLATLAHAPITDHHPEQDGIRVPVTPENYKQFTIGTVADDVQPDGDHVACTVLVQDAASIRKIEAGATGDPSGLVECSAGYGCSLDPTPGVTPQGEIYDAIQRRIRYNHLALGPRAWGRAGASVALRLDSGEAIQAPKETIMKQTIDGKEYTVGTLEWQAAITAHNAKLQASLDAANGRADAAERSLSVAKANPPAIDPKIMNAAVEKRVRLVTDCKRVARACKVKFDDAMAASADESTLILDAIKQLDPSFDPKGKTPEYLAGYFASLVKSLGGEEAAENATGVDDKKAPQEGAMPPAGAAPTGEQKTDAKAGGGIFGARAGNIPEPRQDAAQGPDPDKAREDMNKRNREGWKKPLAATKTKA